MSDENNPVDRFRKCPKFFIAQHHEIDNLVFSNFARPLYNFDQAIQRIQRQILGPEAKALKRINLKIDLGLDRQIEDEITLLRADRKNYTKQEFVIEAIRQLIERGRRKRRHD